MEGSRKYLVSKPVMVKTEMGWPGDCYYSIIFFSRLSYQEWEGALRFFHNLTFFRTISIDRTAVLVLPNKHYYGQKSQNIR